jgi:hypothetical protein
MEYLSYFNVSGDGCKETLGLLVLGQSANYDQWGLHIATNATGKYAYRVGVVAWLYV